MAKDAPSPDKDQDKPVDEAAVEKKQSFAWRGMQAGSKLIKLGSGRMIGFVLLVGIIALRLWDPVPLQTMRLKTFDTYHEVKPREMPANPLISVIDIDEKSLSQMGQWPWARTTMADLVANLQTMGAAVIGFDIVFAEPDRLSPDKVVNNLPGLDADVRERLIALPSNDSVFAETLAAPCPAIGRPCTVLGQSASAEDIPEGADLGTRPSPSLAYLGLKQEQLKRFIKSSAAMVRNIDVLDQASAGRGVFNIHADVDGIIRKVPMIVGVGDNFYPSMTIDMLRVLTANQTVLIKARGEAGVESMGVRPFKIETDESANIWPYFRKHDKSIYVSAVDVLNGTAPVEKIAGHLVIFGTSAVGLQDIRSTPLDRFLPGVDLHVQILENLIKITEQGLVAADAQLSRPREADVMEMFGALVAGLLMIVFVPWTGARWTLVVFLATASGMIGASWYFFAEQRMLFDPVFPTLTALLLYISLTYVNYTREEQQRQQVRGAFSRYMSPALVEQLAQDPSRLALGGEMRDMTLLFCDVRGFTTISEQFDAEGLTGLINKFLTPMTEVILKRKGTIDKYMGDCIMAFWNAPLDDADHANNACESALVMRDDLVTLNNSLEIEAKEVGRKHIPIAIGIGLNSGPACVGNMGSDQRFDYSVLGDTVNLASRLEGQSKTYGVTIVIGEETYKRSSGWAVLEMDLIKVKGKTEAVRIYTLQGYREMAETPEFKSLEVAHRGMLDNYHAQDWDGVLKSCKECRELSKGLELAGLYSLYEGRAEAYKKESPGKDWDGVFTALTK